MQSTLSDNSAFQQTLADKIEKLKTDLFSSWSETKSAIVKKQRGQGNGYRNANPILQFGSYFNKTLRAFWRDLGVPDPEPGIPFYEVSPFSEKYKAEPLVEFFSSRHEEIEKKALEGIVEAAINVHAIIESPHQIDKDIKAIENNMARIQKAAVALQPATVLLVRGSVLKKKGVPTEAAFYRLRPVSARVM